MKTDLRARLRSGSKQAQVHFKDHVSSVVVDRPAQRVLVSSQGKISTESSLQFDALSYLSFDFPLVAPISSISSLCATIVPCMPIISSTPPLVATHPMVGPSSSINLLPRHPGVVSPSFSDVEKGALFCPLWEFTKGSMINTPHLAHEFLEHVTPDFHHSFVQGEAKLLAVNVSSFVVFLCLTWLVLSSSWMKVTSSDSTTR
ncbi:hypothetical protein L1987_60214 [Smallanthus sonchifolius]|uniref:Uncharacterized protein n=1 Tax=Smallanthus sonchifolius TaxID=185202 RepID=A0ACB9D7H5_9ASTR|nr:hypothetical protein L1987_60214 [Smallanthus sonchifolius]